MRRSNPKRYQCSLPVKFLKSASVNFFLSVMVSAFLFGFGCILLMQPWPSPRSGGASRKRLRGEPKRNAVFALLQRETGSAFWAEGACGALVGQGPQAL